MYSWKNARGRLKGAVQLVRLFHTACFKSVTVGWNTNVPEDDPFCFRVGMQAAEGHGSVGPGCARGSIMPTQKGMP